MTGRARTPLAFLAPSILLLGLVTMYPLGYAILLSARKGSFGEVGGFNGLHNYEALWHDALYRGALRFSAIFTLSTVAGCYLLGLVLAIAVHHVSRGQWLLRLGLVMPWVVPGVVSVVAWRWMISDDHAVANVVLGWFGVKPVAFLADPVWAGVMVILLRIWKTFPFMFLVLLAARQSVPGELYEAAALDGATGWSSFRHITMPYLSKVSVIGSLLVAIWSFNDFESIFLLTQGGPSNATYNVVVVAYHEAFFDGNLGLAAAMGVVGLVLLLLLTSVLLRLQRGKAVEA